MMPPEIVLRLSNIRHRLISHRNELPYDTALTKRIYPDGKRKLVKLYTTYKELVALKEEYLYLVQVFGDMAACTRAKNFCHWFKSTSPNEQAI